MADHNDLYMPRKTVLSPARKTDGSQEHPHLEDNLGFHDGQTASSDSTDARQGDDQLLDMGHSKNPIEELPEIMQPVHIPLNADPAIAALLAAINQTNALILQQNQRIWAWENRRSRSPSRRARR